ncbi:hypothetical protein SteCoe_28468 [Stentor coeruleus]|uniref:Uncharacterized protein n=1 Tax=Stentor coeruleus TaxID=5963 RepID=A0A1R2B870_9CILI|nr:hypothetical protein SteCoe_28468 [Stentor coeruleus]
MSISEKNKSKKLSIATPINPFPQISSKKKKPPLLIKLYQTRRSLPDYPDMYILNTQTTTSFNANKIINDPLPPIKPAGFTKNRRFKYLSPTLRLNVKDLRPLFEHKKKVDQSLTTKFDCSDIETETPQFDDAYKISITTKNCQKV